MDAFRRWFIRNQDSIAWFLIGWLVYAGLDSLSKGHYIWALVDWGLAYCNYILSKFRL